VRRNAKTHNPSCFRTSISFPSDLYETLEEIAKGKKVSLAWVLRDATGSYAVSAEKGSSEGHV
jgi:hypothetical protein